MATLADLLRNSPTPIEWEVGTYNSNPSNADGGMQYFKDPNTGNLYTSNDESGQLLASGEALRNADIQGLDLQYIDPSKAQYLYDLKSSNPSQYASQVMGDLSKEINSAYQENQNYDQLWNQFASLKDQNPQEFYKNQLGFLGGQQGWQIGQNTSERNTAGLPVIEQTVAEARAAGLSDNEINQILNNSSQSANYKNQNRIINEQQAGHGPLGMTTQDYLTVAAILGSGAAAAYFAPAAAASSGGGFGLTASQVPNLAAGLGATGGTVGGAGAGWGGLTAASAGGMGLTASSVPSLAAGLELGGAGASAFGVKDAYDAYKTVNQAVKLFGGGGQSPQSVSPNIARTGGNWNYQNQPFLNAQQQSSVYSPTGLNVSGASTPSLDVSRSSNLLANLLRR